jgi:AcrR family transcriptional regulator
MSTRSSSDHPTLVAPLAAATDEPPAPLATRTGISRHLIDVTPGGLQDRILAATLRCLGRWGTVKTTLDDIAREAGCSRATVYRVFPAGRDALFEAAGVRELFRVLHELAEVADAAPDLTSQLTSLLHQAMTAIADHEVLQYLCKHEPGVILPFVSFDGIDPLLVVARSTIAPYLERFLDARTASTTAEWLARIAITLGFDPQDGQPDLTDADAARRYVERFILPGLDDGLLPAPLSAQTPTGDPASAPDPTEAKE